MIAGITASTRRFQGGGFVIKTTDGAVVEIKGPGEVPGTHIFVDMDGYMYNLSQIDEVLSWPEEKPVWLKANGVTFSGADHLTKVPDTLPAWITDMSDMFEECVSFNQDISGWDTSNVTNMSSMFSGCTSFNQDLSGWDTSNVISMDFMFYWCSSFNQDISGWNTSNVTNMESMFYGCTNFDRDISGWDTSNVTNMDSVFVDCTNFNGDISGWDTSNVTNMVFMFARCSSFNQDISGWDTSNVTNMFSMFDGCTSFNQDISGWDVSNVTDMRYMFRGCSSFNQDLSGWCVSNIPSEPYSFSSSTYSWTLPKPVWGTCPQEGGGGEMDVIFPDENGVYYAERSIVQGDAITDASFYEWLHMTTPDGDLVPITQEQANAIKPDLPYTPSPVTFADPKTVTKAVGLSGASETSCIGGVGGLATTSSGGAGPELITEKCRIDIYREGKALYIPELDVSICIFNRGDRLAAFIVDPVPLPSRKAYDDMARRITVQFQRPSGAFVTLNRTVEYGGFSLRSANSTIRSEYLTGNVFKITVS